MAERLGIRKPSARPVTPGPYNVSGTPLRRVRAVTGSPAAWRLRGRHGGIADMLAECHRASRRYMELRMSADAGAVMLNGFSPFELGVVCATIGVPALNDRPDRRCREEFPEAMLASQQPPAAVAPVLGAVRRMPSAPTATPEMDRPAATPPAAARAAGASVAASAARATMPR